MNEKLSIISLILNADIVVQIVMAFLFIASIVSWTIIFSKKSSLLKSKKQLKEIKHALDDGVENIDYIQNVDEILTQSYAEFDSADTSSIERSYRKFILGVEDKINTLEDKLSIIAIIASSSPYIGLFGTVWGIMHSFLSLASVKQATIAIVAPGIAEALIATAFGLFAAIPANIFYNKFSSDIEGVYNSYRQLAEKYLLLLQKQC